MSKKSEIDINLNIGNYVMINGIKNEKTKHLNGTIVQIVRKEDNKFKVIDKNKKELAGFIPVNRLFRVLYNDYRRCVVKKQKGTDEVYMIHYLDYFDINDKKFIKKGVKPSELSISIKGKINLNKSKSKKVHSSVRKKKTKKRKRRNTEDNTFLFPKKTIKVTEISTPLTQIMRKRIIAKGKRIAKEIKKHTKSSISKISESAQKSNTKESEILKLKKTLEKSLEEFKSLNNDHEDLLKKLNKCEDNITKLKEKKKESHEKDILNFRRIGTLEAKNTINRELLQAKEKVLNDHAEHIEKITKKLESVQIYSDVLGEPKRFELNNLKRELVSLEEKLGSDKIKCNICYDEFYKNDLLHCGNNHYICIKRTEEYPDIPSCLESAISSAYNNADGTLKYMPTKKGEKENKPTVCCSGEECKDKKTELNIKSVFSRLHSDGQNEYIKALLKFETDKLEISLQQKFNNNKKIAVNDALENLKKEIEDSTNAEEILRYNEFKKQVSKFIDQNDGILLNKILELSKCKNCGTSISILDGCNALICDTCKHHTCAFCFKDFRFIDAHYHFPQYVNHPNISKVCKEREEYKEYLRIMGRRLEPDYPLFTNQQNMNDFRTYKNGKKIIEEIKAINDLNISNEIVDMLKNNDKSVSWIKDLIKDALEDLNVFNDLPKPENPIKSPKKKGASAARKKSTYIDQTEIVHVSILFDIIIPQVRHIMRNRHKLLSDDMIDSAYSLLRVQAKGYNEHIQSIVDKSNDRIMDISNNFMDRKGLTPFGNQVVEDIIKIIEDVY